MKRSLALTLTIIIILSLPNLLQAGGMLDIMTSINFMRAWTVSHGGVLTGENCFGSEFNADASLKAWPLAGTLPGIPTTWGTITNDSANCNTYFGLTTDDDAAYYYDSENDFIARRLFSNPTVETVLSNLTNTNGFSAGIDGFRDLVLSNTHVYWIGNDGNVWRVTKAGGSAQLFVNTVGGLNMLEATNAWLFMATDLELKQADLSCTPLPCTTINTIDVSEVGFTDLVEVQTVAEGPSGSLIGEVHVYYTTNDNDSFGRGSQVDMIGEYVCDTVFVNFNPVTTCETNVLYRTNANNLLGQVSYRDGFIYFQEYDAFANDTFVFERSAINGATTTIDQADGLFFYGKTEADQSGIYYRSHPGHVKRYTLDAPTQVALQHATTQPMSDGNSVMLGLIALTIVTTLPLGRAFFRKNNRP